MLTPKQEKFAQCIVSGMDGITAYETAYDTKASRQVKYNESNKLLMRDDITARIAELRKPLLNHIHNTALTERERIKKILWDRLERALERDDDTTALKITDQINKMNAEYINVTRDITEEKTNINDLDTKQLQELIKLA